MAHNSFSTGDERLQWILRAAVVICGLAVTPACSPQQRASLFGPTSSAEAFYRTAATSGPSSVDFRCQTVLVEKTDRLYRNIRDWIIVDDLGVTVHFAKEGAIVSPNSRSSDKFMHGIKVLMAKNYVDDLSEEVKKGLREKAEQGHWPGVAHVGYVNNRTTRRIDTDPVRGPLVARVFELYATGEYSLRALTRKAYDIGLRHCRGDRQMTKSEIHRMLQNPTLHGRFSMARPTPSGLSRGTRDPRHVRPGPGRAPAEASGTISEATTRLYGPADLRPLWLLNDR